MSNCGFDYKLSHRRNELLLTIGGYRVIDSKKVILSLDVEEHKIGVKALTQGLQGFCELMEICGRENSDEETLDIQIEALQPGSFEISLDLIGQAGQVVGALGGFAQIVTFLSGTITIITGYLEIARFLQGKLADKVEPGDGVVNISSGNQTFNANTQVFNIYTSNPDAADACRKAMLGFKDDKRVNGISMFDENGKLIISFSRDEMIGMGRKNAYINNTERVCTEENATLELRAAGLDGTTKWKFLYKGHNINVSINDSEFMERVKNSLVRLGNHDVFHAKLEFTEFRDSGGWQAKDYKILKVYNIELNQVSEQTKLFS